MNDADAPEPMDSFERELADSLRRRADGVPAAPLGYTDVQRRIVHRRRRTATMAAAAVTLPAVIGLGFLAGRNTGDERIASDAVMFGDTTLPVPSTSLPMLMPTTTIDGAVMPAGATFRCQGPPIASDEVWQYFGYCEYAASPVYDPAYDPGLVPQTTTIPLSGGPFPTTTTTSPATTTTLVPMAPGSTIDPAVLAEQVLVVDASGGVASMTEVATLLGVTPRYAVVATRTFDETTVMPLGADVTAAFELLERFGVGGFDTWTPDLVATAVPEGVTVVLVIGTSGPLPWSP
ncbi:MAG: hypothetical protein NTZ21_02490 [Actinobacteria bacterium]|nr:hypothetical protein [Actinomycetota bacterium]